MAIHLKPIRGSKFTQILLRKEFEREVLSDSNFLGYKDPTNFSGFESSGFIICLRSFCIGFMFLSVNVKANPMSKHSGLATNPESFALV